MVKRYCVSKKQAYTIAEKVFNKNTETKYHDVEDFVTLLATWATATNVVKLTSIPQETTAGTDTVRDGDEVTLNGIHGVLTFSGAAVDPAFWADNFRFIIVQILESDVNIAASNIAAQFLQQTGDVRSFYLHDGATEYRILYDSHLQTIGEGSRAGSAIPSIRNFEFTIPAFKEAKNPIRYFGGSLNGVNNIYLLFNHEAANADFLIGCAYKFRLTYKDA